MNFAIVVKLRVDIETDLEFRQTLRELFSIVYNYIASSFQQCLNQL